MAFQCLWDVTFEMISKECYLSTHLKEKNLCRDDYQLLFHLHVPPRSGRLAIVIIDDSGTAERMVSRKGRLDFARPPAEREVE